MPLKVNCSCGRELIVEDRHAGGAIRCKACRRPVFVPHTAERIERRDEETMIRAVCECGKRIKASSEHAGQVGECPRCGRSVQLPELRDAEFIPEEASGTGVAGWMAKQNLVDVEEDLIGAQLDDPEALPEAEPLDDRDPKTIQSAAEAALEVRRRLRQEGRLSLEDDEDEIWLKELSGRLGWTDMVGRAARALVPTRLFREAVSDLRKQADNLVKRRRRENERGAAYVGYRGLLNTYPEVSLALVAIVVAAIGWFAWQSQTADAVREVRREKAFYVDTASGEVTTRHASRTGLLFGGSVEGGLVAAVKFGCGGCGNEHDTFVGYLKVYPRDAREAIEKVGAARANERVDVGAERIQAWQRGPLMRRPTDAEDDWVPLKSEAARQRIMELADRCPEGVRVVPCRPK